MVVCLPVTASITYPMSLGTEITLHGATSTLDNYDMHVVTVGNVVTVTGYVAGNGSLACSGYTCFLFYIDRYVERDCSSVVDIDMYSSYAFHEFPGPCCLQWTPVIMATAQISTSLDLFPDKPRTTCWPLVRAPSSCPVAQSWR